LFRRTDVKHSKSERATLAVKAMNQQFNVKAYKNRICPETEELFNDSFWNGLDFVVNAVDNVKARLFVDSRCVWFGKALFESGTLGTKSNS
jgi:ubiquitin-activating enzyme E1